MNLVLTWVRSNLPLEDVGQAVDDTDAPLADGSLDNL